MDARYEGQAVRHIRRIRNSALHPLDPFIKAGLLIVRSYNLSFAFSTLCRATTPSSAPRTRLIRA